jgi:hypothetical protein
VRAVNAWLASRGRGSERIDPTAAYSWVNSGYCPYEPMPDVVATVLSERLGCHVDARQLWPRHRRTRRSDEAPHTAVAGLAGMQTCESLVRALGEMSVSGGMRSAVVPVAGVDLVDAVVKGLGTVVSPADRPAGDRVLPPQAELIVGHVAALRRLDDRQGGGAVSLRYVTSELAAVLDLVRCATYEDAVRRRLFAAVGDLAQLAGWMQWDAGDQGAAQRYLLLSMRIARSAGDDGRALNDAGMLCYIAAHSGQGRDAIQIATAATQMAVPSRLLRARIIGRAATAHAAVGDLQTARSAAGLARDLLTSAGADDTTPYLYYLNPDQLAAEAGQSLLTLAATADVFQRRLLGEAIELLTPLASADARVEYQRSALLHGCYLAEAHLRRRELDRAVEVTRVALSRVPGVRSHRCLALLHSLRGAFAQRKRATVVADFLPELEGALDMV